MSPYIVLRGLVYVMEPNKTVDTMFSVDKNIRYAGVVGPGPGYDIKASRMRSGVKSLTPEEKDREFIQIIPEIILGLAQRLEDELGRISYSLLCFQKLTLMLFKTREHVIVLSLEPGAFAKPIFDKIVSLLGPEQ